LREVEVLNFVGHTVRLFTFSAYTASHAISNLSSQADVRSLAISPDGRWVISGSYDHTARIWDMVDASLQCTLLGHEKGVTSVDFSPTGNYVACGSWDGKVSMWRYKSSGN
jgi:WD40 repeat protein